MADFARVTVDGVEYACSEGVAAVCGRSSEIVEENGVVVRGSVSANEKGYVVEILAKEVFAKMLIRSVKLPSTVISIPEKCFEMCKSLTDVVFEDGSCVSVFGKCCFKGVPLQELIFLIVFCRLRTSVLMDVLSFVLLAYVRHRS